MTFSLYRLLSELPWGLVSVNTMGGTHEVRMLGSERVSVQETHNPFALQPTADLGVFDVRARRMCVWGEGEKVKPVCSMQKINASIDHDFDC